VVGSCVNEFGANGFDGIVGAVYVFCGSEFLEPMAKMDVSSIDNGRIVNMRILAYGLLNVLVTEGEKG